MKKFTWLLLLCASFAFSQKPYYFTNKDTTLLGVKTDKKIIVPLEKHPYTYYIDFTVPINSPVFELPGTLDKLPVSADNPAVPVATVYNKKGKALYYTLLFDNGSDYFQEDVQRIISIKNGKVGFANDEGAITVKPEWDFATPFNYGYAEVYLNVKKEYIDAEHWTVVPCKEEWFRGYVNKKGQSVQPYAVKVHKKDYELENGTFLPYPYAYNSKEEKILKDFETYYGIINDISLYNLYTDSTKKEASLQFEIIRKPSAYFPYYKLQAYRFQHIEGHYTFLYNEKTNAFYYIDYPFTFDDHHLISVKNFIRNNLERIIKDKKESSYERPFEFDAESAYEKWKKD